MCESGWRAKLKRGMIFVSHFGVVSSKLSCLSQAVQLKGIKTILEALRLSHFGYKG